MSLLAEANNRNHKARTYNGYQNQFSERERPTSTPAHLQITDGNEANGKKLYAKANFKGKAVNRFKGPHAYVTEETEDDENLNYLNSESMVANQPAKTPPLT